MIHSSVKELTMHIVLLPLLVALSLPAFAGLGGDATPVAAGQAVGKSVIRRAIPARSYTIQDVQSADGTTVREYITLEGKVFGVSWTGPVMPNLAQLFGDHYESYREAIKGRGPGRKPVHVNSSDLVVESAGHMRAFRGRAYVPQMLPAGVSANEIK
jgi:hypothetical protein